MDFLQKELTLLKNHPERYIIEFHDILVKKFGYVFQPPKVKKIKDGMSLITFDVIDSDNNLNLEVVNSLLPLIQRDCKFDKFLSKEEYSKIFTNNLEDVLSRTRSNSATDPNASQLLLILETFDPKWFSSENIIIIHGYPFLKYWGVRNRYLPENSGIKLNITENAPIVTALAIGIGALTIVIGLIFALLMSR